MSAKLLLTTNRNAPGSALEHELERESFNLCLPEPDTDWANPASVAQCLARHKPDVVINCLGWANRPDEAQRSLLTQAAENLAHHCGGTPLIHLSSYRVFGGDNKSSHSERDPTGPNSEAGVAFLAAEQALASSLDKWLALRLSWVVSSYEDNLLTRLLSDLAESRPLRLNKRLRGAPTPLSDVARVVVAIVKQVTCGAENWGVLQYCSSDACNQAEFGRQLLATLQQQDLLSSEPEVDEVDEMDEGEPVSAVLSIRRCRDCFGVQPRSWRPSLLPMIKQWLHNNPGARF